MTPAMTKEDFRGLGAPDLVYVREIRAADVLADTPLPEVRGLSIDPEAVLYAVHGADGERLAVLQRAGRCRVEGDDVGDGPDLGVGGPVAQIEIEVALELVDEHDRRRGDTTLVAAERIAVQHAHGRAGSADPARRRDAGPHQDGATVREDS